MCCHSLQLHCRLLVLAFLCCLDTNLIHCYYTRWSWLVGMAVAKKLSQVLSVHVQISEWAYLEHGMLMQEGTCWLNYSLALAPIVSFFVCCPPVVWHLLRVDLCLHSPLPLKSACLLACSWVSLVNIITWVGREEGGGVIDTVCCCVCTCFTCAGVRGKYPPTHSCC